MSYRLVPCRIDCFNIFAYELYHVISVHFLIHLCNVCMAVCLQLLQNCCNNRQVANKRKQAELGLAHANDQHLDTEKAAAQKMSTLSMLAASLLGIFTSMPLSAKEGDAIRLFVLSTIVTICMAVLATLKGYTDLEEPNDPRFVVDGSTEGCLYTSYGENVSYVMFQGNSDNDKEIKVSTTTDASLVAIIVVFAALALKILIYILVLHKDKVYKNHGKQESNGFASLFALSTKGAAHSRNGRDWAHLIKNKLNFKEIGPQTGLKNTDLADTRELCNGIAISQKELETKIRKLASDENIHTGPTTRMSSKCGWRGSIPLVFLLTQPPCFVC